MSSISIQNQMTTAADLRRKADEIDNLNIPHRGSDALLDAATELRKTAEGLETQAFEERKEILERLERNAIKSSYSGRPGCCCGCKGNHTESSRSKTLIANKIRAALLDDYANDLELGVNYVALQTDTRLIMVYTD
jgi:hypothetical protein